MKYSISLLNSSSTHHVEMRSQRRRCDKIVAREVQERRPYSTEGLSRWARLEKFMPPVEYDYPYQGKLTVTRVSPEQMRLVCPLPKLGSTTAGCAHVGKGECEIIIANDEWLKALGWNSDIIIRHELGHCNGWPANHPNAETA